MFLVLMLLGLFGFLLFWFSSGLKEAQKQANEDILIGGGTTLFVLIFGTFALSVSLFELIGLIVDIKTLQAEKNIFVIGTIGLLCMFVSFKISGWLIDVVIFGERRKSHLREHSKD